MSSRLCRLLVRCRPLAGTAGHATGARTTFQTSTLRRSFSSTRPIRDEKKEDEIDKKPDQVEEETVVVSRIEHLHILSVGINRPKKRNCIDSKTAEKLHQPPSEVFLDFEADDNMYCAVLHGIGGNFCAGFDLDELAKIDEQNLANVVAARMIDRGPMGPTRMDLTKPVIAAIEGWC